MKLLERCTLSRYSRSTLIWYLYIGKAFPAYIKLSIVIRKS